MPKRRFWNPLKRKKYSAQTMRNRSQKTAETLLLEPTKNKRMRKSRTPAGFVPKPIAKPQPEKCGNVAFGTH